jgi:hypothetical protein
VTALARALAATRERPSLWIVALCGFLARGGIVLLVLPMVPLPSTVGMATFVGPTSVTAAGLTPDSVLRIALLVAFAVGWLIAGSLVGALTDRAIVDELRVRGASADGAAAVHRPGLLVRLVGLRLVALLPLFAVAAIVARSIGELVYQELILPSDIAAPIVLRVVQGAQLQVAAIAIAWIAGEVLGGIAVRLAILEGRSFAGAAGGAVTFVVRHPLRALVASVAGLFVLLIGVAPALVAIGLAWATLGEAASGSIDDLAVIRATILVVGVWATSALLAAIVAAWRGALWTFAVVRVAPPA